MTDEEIEKKAEEYAQGNFYSEQGYIYGFEIGFTEGRKEGFDVGYKKATERAYERQQDLTDTYIRDGKKIEQLKKENARLKKRIKEMRDSVREVLANPDVEVGMVMECVGLTWIGKDEIEELKKDKEYLDNTNNEQTKVILELQAQIEKMKNFIFEEVDFCSYCPLTNECRNDEGTCPYAYTPEKEQKKILAEWITKIGS